MYERIDYIKNNMNPNQLGEYIHHNYPEYARELSDTLLDLELQDYLNNIYETQILNHENKEN